MRILCCLNRDLASNLALNLLLPALQPHTVRVGLTEQVGRTSLDEPWQRRELRIAEQILPNLTLFPLVERAAPDDSGQRNLTFTEIQRLRGIPVDTLADPNCAAGLDLPVRSVRRVGASWSCLPPCGPRRKVLARWTGARGRSLRTCPVGRVDLTHQARWPLVGLRGQARIRMVSLVRFTR